jgi:hypothetical protein
MSYENINEHEYFDPRFYHISNGISLYEKLAVHENGSGLQNDDEPALIMLIE